MLGTWKFHLLMEPAKPPFPNRRQVYVFNNRLTGPNCDRDLFSEGRLNFASETIGAAMKLDRFNSLAAWAVHGRTAIEARAFLVDAIAGFDDVTKQKLRTHRYDTDESFTEAWSKFERQMLPLLIKYEILVEKQ